MKKIVLPSMSMKRKKVSQWSFNFFYSYLGMIYYLYQNLDYKFQLTYLIKHLIIPIYIYLISILYSNRNHRCCQLPHFSKFQKTTTLISRKIAYVTCYNNRKKSLRLHIFQAAGSLKPEYQLTRNII